MVENKVNCEQIWREISSYIDGEVDVAFRPAMEEHFKTCKRCASVLAGTQNVVKLYGDERMLEVPAGFSRRLERKLERRLTQGSAARGGRWSTWSAWLVPVAAMALIAGGVLVVNSLTFRNYIQSRHAQPGNNVPPEMVVVVSDRSKVFHVPGCPFIHDKASERTMTAKEATQQGYTPCTRCLRQYLKSLVTGRTGDSVAEGDVEPDDGNDREEVLSVAGH